jgi:hypothetical protein
LPKLINKIPKYAKKEIKQPYGVSVFMLDIPVHAVRAIKILIRDRETLAAHEKSTLLKFFNSRASTFIALLSFAIPSAPILNSLNPMLKTLPDLLFAFTVFLVFATSFAVCFGAVFLVIKLVTRNLQK